MYSPPPMSEFSPPPMSEFSPPPMEDLSPLADFPPSTNGFSPPPDLDTDVGGVLSPPYLESYDLTGLSDKLSSLEKVVSLPPREILELQQESDHLNTLFSNNLRLDIGPPVGRNGAFNSDNYDDDEGETSDDKVDIIEEEDVGVLDQEANDSDTDFKTVLEETQSIDQPSEDAHEVVENVTGLAEAEEVHVPSDKVPDVPFNADSDQCEVDEDDKFPNGDDVNAFIVSKNDMNCDSETFPSKSMEENFDPDDCWGNFGSAENGEEVNDDEGWGNSDWAVPERGDDLCDRTKPGDDARSIEFDEDCEDDKVGAEDKVGEDDKVGEEEGEDDEFGDFGLADEQQTEDLPSLTSCLEQLEGREQGMVGDMFSDMREEEKELEMDRLSDVVLGDEEVFQPIENPSSTPGLEYKWRDSVTYNILLRTLGIDSKIVLDGEGWRSSVPHYVPKTAATLLTPGELLTPVLAPQEGGSGQVDKERERGTPEPQFDWSDSGLVNPLEAESGTSRGKQAQTNSQPAKVITELLASQQKEQKSKKANSHKESDSPPSSVTTPSIPKPSRESKPVSKEAAKIVSAFPLLDFMHSKVLLLPLTSHKKEK